MCTKIFIKPHSSLTLGIDEIVQILNVGHLLAILNTMDNGH